MNYTRIQIGFGYYICLVRGYIIGFSVRFHRFLGFIFSKGHIGDYSKWSQVSAIYVLYNSAFSSKSF